MRILVTGGAGFVGSHLVERLYRQGYEVLSIDTAYPHPNTSLPFAAVRADCRDISRHAHQTISKYRFDFCYHLAATVGVKRVLADPAECISNNIDSLTAVLKLGIPGIFASTSEVYGRTRGLLSEDSPLEYSSKTRWAYAQSKIIGEHLARAVGWKVVRFFNIVGPRQSSEYGAVLPTFVKQALSGEPITIYGDGTQLRTFLDVQDCAQILALLRDKDFSVVNVGGDRTLSVGELATLVGQTLSDHHPLKYVSYSDAYPQGFEECYERIPNLKKLRSLIGDFQFKPLGKTILEVAESLKEKLCPAQMT